MNKIFKFALFLCFISSIAYAGVLKLGTNPPGISAGGTSQNAIIIDADSTEAFLVRKDGDAGDILIVDTTNSDVQLPDNISLDLGTDNDWSLISDAADSDAFTILTGATEQFQINKSTGTTFFKPGGAEKLRIGSTGISFSTTAVPLSNDGAALGGTSNQWSDLYLASGGVINFSNGTQTITNSATNLAVSGTMTYSVTTGVTASSGQAQGGSELTTVINEVSTVGVANDSVTLPTAVAGLVIYLINNGANTMQVFPASGDNIDGAGVDTAVTQGAGTNLTYVSIDDTNWNSFKGSL